VTANSVGMASDPIDGYALGVDLQVVATEDGGRTKPIGIADEYPPMQYRPNWGLPGMAPPEQTGAPVVCFGSYPVLPGDTLRAVIIPMFPDRVGAWSFVEVGDPLLMYEGSRVCGRATVRWVRRSQHPVPESDQARFCDWAGGGPDPVA
jgi:hypothetical protein